MLYQGCRHIAFSGDFDKLLPHTLVGFGKNKLGTSPVAVTAHQIANAVTTLINPQTTPDVGTQR